MDNMNIINISSNDKILILSPHPDDEAIGCGGLLLKYGKQCDVICLTDGRQGQGDVTPISLSQVRKSEFQSSMNMLDVSFYKMLEVEDGTLCGHTSLLENIDLSKYNKIFVTGRADQHPDHTAAEVALKRALEYQNIYGIEIYEYEVHKHIQNATHQLIISDLIEKKKEIIRIYDSQIKNVRFDEKIGQINLSNGDGKEYIEVYKKIDIGKIDDDLGLEIELQKSREFYWIYTRWMFLNNRKYRIADYLGGNNSIVVYGYKEIGVLLETELNISNIDVLGVIDNDERLTVKYPQKTIVNALEGVDLGYTDATIIVTATYYFEQIKKQLESLGYKKVLSLKHILEEMEYKVEKNEQC